MGPMENPDDVPGFSLVQRLLVAAMGVRDSPVGGRSLAATLAFIEINSIKKSLRVAARYQSDKMEAFCF